MILSLEYLSFTLLCILNVVFRSLITSPNHNNKLIILLFVAKFFNSFFFSLINSYSSSIIFSSPSLSGLPRCLFLSIMRYNSLSFLAFSSFISYFTCTSLSKFKSLTFCILFLFANISFKYYTIWSLGIFFYNSVLQKYLFNTIPSSKTT